MLLKQIYNLETRCNVLECIYYIGAVVEFGSRQKWFL